MTPRRRKSRKARRKRRAERWWRGYRPDDPWLAVQRSCRAIVDIFGDASLSGIDRSVAPPMVVKTRPVRELLEEAMARVREERGR